MIVAALEDLDAEVEQPDNEWWVETAEMELNHWLEANPIAGPSNTSSRSSTGLDASTNLTENAANQPSDQSALSEQEVEPTQPTGGFMRRPMAHNPWE